MICQRIKKGNPVFLQLTNFNKTISLPVKTAELGVNLWMKPIRTCDGSGPNYYEHNEHFRQQMSGMSDRGGGGETYQRELQSECRGGGGLQKVQQPKNVLAVLSEVRVLVSWVDGWLGPSSRDPGVANQNAGISRPRGSVTSWEAVSPFLFCNCRCVQSVLHHAGAFLEHQSIG
jgi:hypothetical protein